MRLTGALLLGLLAVLAALWAAGALAGLGWRLAGLQREAQDALAGALAAVRGGDRVAAGALVALCAGYGFLHAVGPGHGKALVAGAAVATRARARRMALIAFAGALAQAGAAIVLVYGAFALAGATARGLSAGAERWAAPAGDLLIAGLGAWLLVRGLRAARTSARGDAGAICSGCGHRHGPTAEEATAARSPAAALALVAAMAARPCAGAIFVLAVAWRMGLPWLGAAGVIAMGLGVAAFTMLVAWTAVAGRDAALAGGEGAAAALLGRGAAAARLVAPGLQIIGGACILALGAAGLVAALPA